MGSILSVCLKNFESFRTFFAKKRRVECTKIVSRDKGAWLIAYFRISFSENVTRKIDDQVGMPP